MYQIAAGEKKQRLRTARYTPDKEFHAFLELVETNNVYQVKSRLRTKSTAFRLVATAEKLHGNTPLHRAVSLGLVEMTLMLLEAGANLDEVNTMGDAPIHCCWRFWKSDAKKYFLWRKNPYLMITRKHLEDFDKMVSMGISYLQKSCLAGKPWKLDLREMHSLCSVSFRFP